MTEEPARRLRADAQANEDRVLEAAARAFARDGADASVRAIAKDAGVGIGTVYRRFPAREDLVWAIYRSEVDRICALVPDLLAQQPPAQALRAWMESFLDFLAAKRGMADALKAALSADKGQRLETRALITDALAGLLAAGTADETIRPDADALDVMMALGGIALIAGEPEQRQQAARLRDLLMDGLRPLRRLGASLRASAAAASARWWGLANSACCPALSGVVSHLGLSPLGVLMRARDCDSSCSGPWWHLPAQVSQVA
ncbi:MAG TPA: TetR/AcrR family transcriptional regulator, partial [Trebonia sp.]